MSRAAPADAIVVLGHRVEADGRPGPELSLRLERGMSLLLDARAPFLVCSGGRDPDEPVSAAESMIRVALAAGVAHLLATGLRARPIYDALEARRVRLPQSA